MDDTITRFFVESFEKRISGKIKNEHSEGCLIFIDSVVRKDHSDENATAEMQRDSSALESGQSKVR